MLHILYHKYSDSSNNLCYPYIQKEKSGAGKLHRDRKEKDMTAINRFSQLHSERKALASLSDREWSFDLMHSFKAGQERENFVLDIAAGAGE